MEHPEKFDPMLEIWKIMIDALRKQAFSVMLLLGAVVGLWTVMQGKEDRFERKMSTLEQKVDTMAARYMHCEMSRARLAAKVEVLTVQVDALTAIKMRYQGK